MTRPPVAAFAFILSFVSALGPSHDARADPSTAEHPPELTLRQLVTLYGPSVPEEKTTADAIRDFIATKELPPLKDDQRRFVDAIVPETTARLALASADDIQRARDASAVLIPLPGPSSLATTAAAMVDPNVPSYRVRCGENLCFSGPIGRQYVVNAPNGGSVMFPYAGLEGWELPRPEKSWFQRTFPTLLGLDVFGAGYIAPQQAAWDEWYRTAYDRSDVVSAGDYLPISVSDTPRRSKHWRFGVGPDGSIKPLAPFFKLTK